MASYSIYVAVRNWTTAATDFTLCLLYTYAINWCYMSHFKVLIALFT